MDVRTRGGIFGSQTMYGGGLFDGTEMGFGAVEQAAAGLGQSDESGRLHAFDDGVFAAPETMLDGPLQAYRDGSMGQYEQAAAGLGRGWSEEAGEKWLGGMGWTEYAGEQFMGQLGAAGLGALPGFPQSCYDVTTYCGSGPGYQYRGEYDYLKSQYNDPNCDPNCKAQIEARIYGYLQPTCSQRAAYCRDEKAKVSAIQKMCGNAAEFNRFLQQDIIDGGGNSAVTGTFTAKDCLEWKKLYGGYPALDARMLEELDISDWPPNCVLAVPNCPGLVGGGTIIPSSCGPGEEFINGQCVKTTCPSGQQLVGSKCEVIPVTPQKKSKATMWIVGGLIGAGVLTGLYYATRKKEAA